MWETWIYDSKTGTPIDRVYPIAFPWTTSLLGDGSATTSFKIDDSEHPLTRDEVHSLFAPNANMIVLRWGSYVAYAGKIDDWVYDRDAVTVAVTSVELETEWSWRLTYGVSGYEFGTLTVTNRTHSGAVAAILARATQWSSDWAYPLDLPADASGSFSATWQYWKKFKISDLLEQVRSEGYEIYLRPYLTGSDMLRFQVRVATRITIGASSFILQAAESPLRKVRYQVDGSRQLTGLQGVGNGTGQDQEVAWAGAGPYPIPIRDAKQDFADLTGARLQAATTNALQDEDHLLQQWSIGEFQIDDTNPPEEAAPGRVWNIDTQNDPVIPDGRHTLRVIKVSGDLGMTIRTEVQSAT